MNNWVEIVPEQSKASKNKNSNESWLDKVDAEVSCTSWNNDNRVIVIRDLIDDEKFIDFVMDVLFRIPKQNNLVLCDVNSVIENKKSKNSKKWSKFFEYCKGNAHVLQLGKDISSMDSNAQAKFVVEQFKQFKKIISFQAALLLIELVGANRTIINSEVEKICNIIDEQDVTEQHIRDTAFPMSQDYPVWLFYSAFNTGSFKKIMDAAHHLLENGFAHDMILILSLKQLRWQVIFASQLLKNGRVDLGVFADMNTMNAMKRQLMFEKQFSNKRMDPRIYRQLLSEIMHKKEYKPEKTPSYYNMRDINTFLSKILGNFLKKTKNFESEKHHAKVVLDQSIERYLTAYNGLYDVRSCEKANKDSTFIAIMQKLSVVG